MLEGKQFLFKRARCSSYLSYIPARPQFIVPDLDRLNGIEDHISSCLFYDWSFVSCPGEYITLLIDNMDCEYGIFSEETKIVIHATIESVDQFDLHDLDM